MLVPVGVKMEGRSSPLTLVFGFWLRSRKGGKPDGKAEAAHRKGSGSSNSWGPPLPLPRSSMDW